MRKVVTVEKALRQSIINIEDLCNMVNNYSKKLGLGQKVRVEDFTEHAREALNNLLDIKS